MKTLEGQLDETLMTDRLIALLAAGFGLLATVLASIGLYGVMAFVVARRRKELGIRLALGAEPGGVIWLVMKEVLLLLAIGLAVGIPSALALGQLRRVAAVWHPGARSVDRDRDAGPADGGLGRRRPDPRAPRQPHRSDSGAAIRIRGSFSRAAAPRRRIAVPEGRRLALRAFRQTGKTALRFDPDEWSRRSSSIDHPIYQRSASGFAGRRCDLRSDRREVPRSAPFLRTQRSDSRRSLRETPSLRSGDKRSRPRSCADL